MASKQSWWRRLVDGKEPIDPNDEPAPPSEREPALEAEIERDPEAIDPYLIYADWLSDHGDPRGELIALQARCTAQVDETRWDPAVRTLDPWTTLDGEHAAAARALIERYPNRLGGELRPGDHAEWHCGYWRRLHVALEPESPFRLRTQIASALGQDSARFLRALSIEARNGYSAAEYLPELPATLRTLHLGALAVPVSSALSGIEPIEPLWQRARTLQTIVLQGSHLLVADPFEAPILRSLELVTDDIHPRTLQSVARSQLPALDTLIIWLGGMTRRREPRRDDIAALVASPRPTLRHFGLVRCRIIDDVIAVIAEAPWASQLRVLDLSRGRLTALGIAELERVRDRFPELRYLDLSQSALLDARSRDRARSLAPEVRLSD